MSIQFDIEKFGRQPETIAQLVRSDDVFSLMRRRVALPPACAALVRARGGQAHHVPGGGTVEADGASEILFVRTTPVDLHYDVPSLRSEDGYDFSATVELTICVVPERSELELLRKVLLGSGSRVDIGRIRKFCEEPVRSALTEFARTRSAADLSAATTWDKFDAVLDERFKPVGFASGLALGPDPRVTFASPAFTESRRMESTAALRRQRLEADALPDVILVAFGHMRPPPEEQYRLAREFQLQLGEHYFHYVHSLDATLRIYQRIRRKTVG